jgi:hypothetical protein
MIPYAFKSPRNARHQPGAALIITLSMLMLVAFVVVAFLARTSREAVLVNSAAGGQKADILANSVAELIVADLKSEMRAGSKETTTSDITILQPSSAIAALPSRSRLSAASGAPFDNLLKQSGASDGMFSTTAPRNQNNVTPLISTATSTATIKPSFDGRVVSASRWDKPQLLVDGNFSDNEVPNWVLLNRLGVAESQSWNANLRDRAPTNDNFAIGRFAYNIYDVSGLLDVNVAGSPAGLDSAEIGRKGSLGLAALAEIPGIASAANADLFVREWRNKLTAATPEDFLSYHGFGKTTNPYYNFGLSNGFQKTATSASDSDNRLLSRQDLIKLAANGKFGITTAALPYLTSFSRATNAPTWGPTTPSGSSIDYAAEANTPAAANRFQPNVRVTASFTRADGTKAEPGEPLLKTRFALSRLAGLGRKGVETTGNTTLLNGIPSPASDATIQRDFGLVWQTDRWSYAGPSGASAQDSIATLGSISGREPNFFELLKASILSGSLGKTAGNSWLINSMTVDAVTDNQIIRIGACIIDQYDADSFVTRINFDGNDMAGVENLPYLNRLFTQQYRLTSSPINNNGYLMVELWNPHQPKENKGASPTEFRVLCDKGRVRINSGSVEDKTKAPLVYNYGAFQPSSTSGTYRNTDSSVTPPITRPNGLKFGTWLSLAGSSLTFSVASNKSDELFTWPTLLTQRVSGASASAPSSSSNNKVVDGPVQFVGFYVGKVACSSDTYGNYMGIWNPCYGAYIENKSADLLTFYLQYNDGTSWVSYSDWQNVTIAGMWDGGGNRGPGDATSPAIYLQAADPRSTRFGLFLNYSHERTADPRWSDPSWTGGPAYQDSIGKTLRPDSTQKKDTLFGADPQFGGMPYGVGLQPAGPLSSGWGPSPLAVNPDRVPSYRFGYLAENKDTLPTWYKDNDGILRNGDASYASGAWGQPLEQVSPAAGQASRPLILDRPFRSVAEMGYAFRDLPYKSLDFFTANSGDAALLDIFCLNESPISAVTAGVLNPNTRLQPVLKAVLAGALKDELDSASGLTGAPEASAIATAITTATATTPLMNRSELATRIAPVLTAQSFSNKPADAAIKARRESVVRALADVSNTRTWNLMVDLIVQSGRYPAGASNVDQFSVDGERRYWLHLAIDRYTGRVVARSMESVNE